jgi:multiple antibiotic resistance protein
VNELVKSILLIITALFPIVNPLGNSPIFLSLTQEYGTATRKILARKVAINSFVLLVASFIVGSHILAFFGISIPVVQVGGGLIVISTGWSLLTQKDASEKHGEMRKDVNPLDAFRNAFYPLTLPLTVGPGSISIAVTLGANEQKHFGPDIQAIGAAIIGSALLAASIYLCYGFAERLARALGENGMTIVVRLSSFLLVCIGVQIFWNGMSALVRNLSLGAG